MVSIPGYDIRYTTFSDATWLEKWLSTPGILHWFPLSHAKELEEGIQNWIGFSRYHASVTAIIDEIPCGIATLFLMPYRKVAHECLFKLIVDPEKPRQGIGRSLLKNLMHLAKTRFHLEFMLTDLVEGNPLEHLLTECGFQKLLRQENFFKEDGQYLARLLMERDLRGWESDGK